MFCRHCGKKIKDNALFCPYCGKRTAINTASNTALERTLPKKHKKKKWLWILGAVLLSVTAFIAIITFMILSIVFNTQGSNILPIELTEEEINANTTVYDNGDKIYLPGNENIVFDEDEYMVYYNNLLTVYLLSDLSANDADDLARTVGGIVVGDISGCINMLQIMVADTDLDTLKSYADLLMESEQVLYASYSFPIEISEETSKLWGGDNDLENEYAPGGADWWAEAVGAYTAWEFSRFASPITVGIIDDGFDTDHEDLTDNEGQPIITMLNENSIDSEHGTHVAGLIAAQNNDFGIRGIADTADFVCVDWSASNGANLLTPSWVIENTKQMIEYAQAAGTPIVINNSWGARLGFFDWLLSVHGQYNKRQYNKRPDKQTKTEKHAVETSKVALGIIEELLWNGIDDFIIVQSAGNGYENEFWGYEASLSGWYRGITEQLCKQYPGRFDYETIKSHVVIVGAVKNETENGMYKLTGFSNYGESVDIYAPGYDVYSTVLNDKYDYLPGTSMAAPIVSGAAAYIWSLDPSLSAAEVKQRLIDTGSKAVGVTGEDKGREYPMLNIGAAAISVAKGNIECKVVDRQTGEALSGVTCTRTNDVSDAPIFTMDLLNSNDGMLYASAIGHTTLILKKEGYKDTEVSCDVEVGKDINLGAIFMEVEGAVDLTQYLDSIEKMYHAIGGKLSDERGDHEKWYINTGIQYGNYMESEKVDEIYIDGEGYRLYGIYLGENVNEAANRLKNSGWVGAQVNDDKLEFEWENQCIWIRSIADKVSSYGFWRYEKYVVDADFEGTEQFMTSMYKVFDINMTWQEAEDYCEKLGGHLATIADAAEQAFVEKLAVDFGRYENYWIGGYYLPDENAWKWVTGEKFSYTNWDQRQPDNNTGNEYYLRMVNQDLVYSDWNAHTGKWDDTANEADGESGDAPLRTFGFICEWSDLDPWDNLAFKDAVGMVG